MFIYFHRVTNNKIISKRAIRLLLFSIYLFTNNSFAQCPPNIDFEFGSFTNWICDTGHVDKSTGNLIMTSNVGPIPGRHTIINASSLPALDPFGNFSVLCPNGSGNSIRLGNSIKGGEADAVSYKFTIPITQNLFNLTYQYAVVFEDPTHLAFEQPRVRLSIIDSATNSIITCSSYDYVAQGGLSGFLLSNLVTATNDPIYYKSWTPTAINLTGYAGKTIIMKFSAADCAKGKKTANDTTGHFGYAYIDVNSSCGSSAVANGFCANSLGGLVVLNGPPGYDTYQWYNANLTTNIDSGEIININAPPVTTTYAVIVTPFPGFGCLDTFYTQVSTTPLPAPTADFSFPQNYCSGSLVQFHDSSTTNISTAYVSDWHWDFGDPNATNNSAPPNPDTSILQNPLHFYSAQGTYNVQLIITTSIGCKDTIVKQIIINQTPPNVPLSITNDSLCAPYDTTTISWSGTIQPGYSYQWYINDATLINGNLNQSNPIQVRYDSSGTHFVGFSIIPPATNDSSCWGHQDISIYVKGRIAQFELNGQDTVCIGNGVSLQPLTAPLLCGGSSFICVGDSTFSVGQNDYAGSDDMPSPFLGENNQRGRIQMLYLASELNGIGMNGGPINNLIWTVTNKKTNNANEIFHNFNIKLACVPYSSFPNSIFDTITNTTLVYTNNNYSTTFGPNLFNFSSPYTWNGTSNLLVEVCFDNTNTTLSTDEVKRTNITSGAILCVYRTNNTAIMSGCNKKFPSNFTNFITPSVRPDIQFNACNYAIPNNTIYSWSSVPAGFTSNADSVFLTPTITTTYTLQTEENGCTNSKSFTINVLNIDLSLPNDTSFCIGNTIQSNATVVGNSQPIVWTLSPALPFTVINPTTISIVPTDTVMIIASLQNSLCPKVDTQWLYPTNLPIITLADTLNVCTGDTIYINATSNMAGTFTWSTPVVGNTLSCNVCNNPLVTVLQSGTLNLNFSAGIGCASLDSVVLIAVPIPIANFTIDSNICLGQTTLVYSNTTYPNGTIFNWHYPLGSAIPGGSISDSQTISYAIADTFLVSLNIINSGCASDTVNHQVIVNAIPTATFTHNPVNCEGDTLHLLYNGNAFSLAGASIQWSIPGSATVFSGSITNDSLSIILASGLNIIKLITSNNNCHDTIIDSLNINVIPIANFSLQDTLCFGQTGLATYIGALDTSNNYTWNFGSALGVPGGNIAGPHVLNFGSLGNFIVSLQINNKGCISNLYKDSVSVLAVPSSGFSITGNHCQGDTVTFTFNGTHTIEDTATWQWPVGTIVIDSTSNYGPINAILPVGNNFISLLVANKYCNNLFLDSFLINAIPTPNTSLISPIACTGQANIISYTGNASCLATFNWNWDGGTVNAATNCGPWSVLWNATGIHNISLQVIENGCSSSIDTITIPVFLSPVSMFTHNNPICFGDTLLLNYTGLSTVLDTAHWLLPFGSNIIAGDTNSFGPLSVILPSGNNIVTLTVHNQQCTASMSDTILVSIKPDANFSFSPTQLCLGQTTSVSLQATAIIGAVYNWNFGSATALPGGQNYGPHVLSFPTVGNYTIGLRINNNGCKSDSITKSIIVYPIPASTFNFNAPHCFGDTLILNYTGIATLADTALWSLPTGTSIITGAINSFGQIKAILPVGNHNISLTVHNQFCNSTTVQNIQIFATPNAAFTLTQDTICLGNNAMVSYTGGTTAPATFNWNFGTATATPGGTTAGPHTLTFASSGLYNISLVVAKNGCISPSVSKLIHVFPIPNSNFTSNTPFCIGDTLVLTYTGTSIAGDIPTWTLPAGSSIVSGSINSFGILKVILPIGVHTIKLTVNNTLCSSVSTKVITVSARPSSSFTLIPQPVCFGQNSLATYNGNASGAAIFTWNFGTANAFPGGNAVGPHSLNFPAVGIYPISLTISDNNCVSITTHFDTVNVVPTATFAMNNINCLGDTLILTYSGIPTANDTALWSLPVGTTIISGTINSFGVLKAILPAGNNSITLTVHNKYCSTSTIQNLSIFITPTASFNLIASTICLGQNATATYTGNGSAAATYTWNFGLTTATPGGNIQGPHTLSFPAIGIFPVSLTVSENNCTSTTIIKNDTVVALPISSFNMNAPHCNGDTLILNYTGIAGAMDTALWQLPIGTTIVSGSINSFTTIKAILPVGNHIIKLTVHNRYCSTNSSQPIQIFAKPTATVNLLPSTVCINANTQVTYTGNANCNTATFTINSVGATINNVGANCGPWNLSWAVAGVKTIYLTVSENGCSNTDTFTITVNTIPTANFTLSTDSICSGSNFNINYTGSATAGATFNWLLSGSPTPASLTGVGPHTVSYSFIGNTTNLETISLIVTQNGCASASFSQSITIVPIPDATFTIASPICEDINSNLTFTGINYLPGYNVNFSWVGATVISGSNLGPYVINYANAGNFTITLNISQYGCSNSTSQNIVILPTPLVAILSDQTICNGDTVMLIATGASSYIWNNGLGISDTIFVTPSVSTYYTVTGSNAGCTDVDSAYVIVNALPIANAGNDTIIETEKPVLIGSSEIVGNTYLWSPNNNLNQPNIAQPIATPKDSTSYVVTVTNSFGCKSTDTVTIYISRCVDAALPNAFTPNGDGENDIFRVKNIEIFSELIEFKIYNRWGEKIFSTSDLNTGWDGKYKGVEQKVGTYIYYVIAKCITGQPINMQGNFELIK
jgi:gliding motility-associated-like protein